MQALCSLISILSLACASMLCCWHYVGFWLCRCWGDFFLAMVKLVAGVMSGTQIRRESMLQYSVQTRISEWRQMLILVPAHTAYVSSRHYTRTDIAPASSLRCTKTHALLSSGVFWMSWLDQAFASKAAGKQQPRFSSASRTLSIDPTLQYLRTYSPNPPQ